MASKVKNNLPIIIIAVIVVAIVLYRIPFKLREYIPGFDDITSFKIIEWTGGYDREYEVHGDVAQELLAYFNTIYLRRAIDNPQEFRMFPKETYTIWGRTDADGWIYYAHLNKGYMTIDSDKTFRVVEPSSFEDIHTIASKSIAE